MKIEIDFDNKVIKLENKVNFKELMEFIQTLPNWEQFAIDAKTEIVWNPSPIIIERDRWINPNPYTPRPFWYEQPPVTFTYDGTGKDILEGSYQLELIN